MEINKVLKQGSFLSLPYQETTNMTIFADGLADFDIKGLGNNRTGQYGDCLKIIKYLGGGNLRIRAIRSSDKSFVFKYQNNGFKDKAVINDEIIDINLDDTTITLNVDDHLNLNIHINSNDEVITKEVIEQEKEKKENLNNQNKSLKEQYEILKQENYNLVNENEKLKNEYQMIKNQNEELMKENEKYQKDIKEVNEIFKENQNQNDLLQKQFDGTLRHYDITKDVFEEYRKENNSQEIKDILMNIKAELKEAENLLKKYIEAKQKQVDKIRQTIKPE